MIFQDTIQVLLARGTVCNPAARGHALVALLREELIEPGTLDTLYGNICVHRQLLHLIHARVLAGCVQPYLLDLVCLVA